VGKPELRRPGGIFRLKLENNIEMDLQEVGCNLCTGLIWLRIVIGGGHL
jgi:hypothetical protein